MLRAGLVPLILFFTCIGLVASAPLPERPSSLVGRYDDYDDYDAFLTRSFAVLQGREFELTDPEYIKREYFSVLDDREFNIDDDEYIKRQDDMSPFDGRNFEQGHIKQRDDSDVHMLYRRKSIFTKIKEGFKKFGHAIKSGFQKAGHAIKAGFKKVGHALKTGFQKVGRFIKKTAGKIAKFGLKIVAAVASVASKVVKFIPGVGEGLSIAIKGAAIGANAASNKIHANLGKLDKVSKGLDYVISPFGTAAKHMGKGASVVSDLLT